MKWLNELNPLVLAAWTGALLVLVVIMLLAIIFNRTVEVVDFDSCVASGGVVRESVPRRCSNYGVTYVEPLGRFRSSIQSDNQNLDVYGNSAATGSEQIVLVVGPERISCTGLIDQKCLVVDGELWYDPIVGFDHQEGNIYKMLVNRSLAFGTDDVKEIPADASLYRYELERVLSLAYIFTPEPEVEPEQPFEPVSVLRTVSIGPFMVDCPEQTNLACLVIDSEIVDYGIDDFVHRSGFEYVVEYEETLLVPIEVDVPDDQKYRRTLKEVKSQEPIPGFVPPPVATTTATTSESATSTDDSVSATEEQTDSEEKEEEDKERNLFQNLFF